MRIAALIAACALIGCATSPPDVSRPAVGGLSYQGIETRLLDTDLVNFSLAVGGASSPADMRVYGDCAAAQYALIRGYRFARHVRTNIEETGPIWRADAVYTISADIPRGTQTLDAGLTVAICQQAGVPTV
ncbi:MAG: hypothetical protein AAGF78_05530 [Pseudomonadota bacterium]